MQALAGSLTASGGIGIAKMITKHLHAGSKSEKDLASPSSNADITPAKTSF
jgi:Rod binding domain-containing protein